MISETTKSHDDEALQLTNQSELMVAATETIKHFGIMALGFRV
jgi:hypothetical protein